jgi:polysaccharide deacetylase family protein (PEP-CTERM system associated)
VSAARRVAIRNAMTVDVEDYFHANVFDDSVDRERWPSFESRVVGNTERLLALFDDFGVRGTFFVLGCVAEQFPALARTIVAHGHELASHGHWHMRITRQTPDAFRADIRRAKRTLEDATGAPVMGYRAPSFSVTSQTLWALEIIAEEGHLYDASVFPVHHDSYGIPNAPRHAHPIDCQGRTLLEAPGSTVRFGRMNLPIAGGAYFRLLPYAWARFGIRRVNRTERKPAIFYVHPWEIDAGQPRLPANRLGSWKHYRNLGKTERRLRRLLADFRFAPLFDVLSDAYSLRPVPAHVLPPQHLQQPVQP